LNNSIKTLASDLSKAGIAFQTDAPLSALTTFKIGGPAGLLASPSDTHDVANTVKAANELGIDFVTLGAGSNILVDDEGWEGLIISTFNLTHIEFDRWTVRCGAGVTLPNLANLSAERGLSDLIQICDIPGTLGGGAYMNAGCSGVSLGDLIVDVTWVETDGSVVSKPRSEITMGYRESEFSGTSRIITEITLKLTEERSSGQIQAEMNEVRAARASKFPLDYPNCGSVFKRVSPEDAKLWLERGNVGAFSAGFFIERAGLKKARIGGAMISDEHANFIINLGNAKASDVRALIELATEKVLDKFGIKLVREVIYLGARGKY